MRTYTLYPDNPDELLKEGISLFREYGESENTRNGMAKVLPGVLSVCYENENKVILNPIRKWPTFFAFFEPLWMLAGRKDVKFVSEFVTNMKNYSDDGISYHAAYGFRWRYHFQYPIDNLANPSKDNPFHIDQLEEIIDLLRNNPDSRRAVISIWDPKEDLNNEIVKDIPCNLTIKVDIRNGCLNLYVFNRSNDFIWGLTTANLTQFLTLKDYLASCLGVRSGTYFQISCNAHIYEEHWDNLCTELFPEQKNWVIVHKKNPPRRLNVGYGKNNEGFKEDFDLDLLTFFNAYESKKELYSDEFKTLYFRHTVLPMWQTHSALKTKDFAYASMNANLIDSLDWREAASQIIDRKTKAGTDL